MIARWLTALLMFGLIAASPAFAANGDRMAFTIKDFRLENSQTLPTARVMYATYGTLNAARDNAVLLPSHYMADARGYYCLGALGPI